MRTKIQSEVMVVTLQRTIPMMIAFALCCCSCQSRDTGKHGRKEGMKKAQIKVTSSAFGEGGTIPRQYTHDGKNVSPPLSWESVPARAKSLALICDDPDAPAGDWVHWVLYNLPPGVKELPKAVPIDKVLRSGAQQGTNDFRTIGYNGPSPPSVTHRYFFKLYALDVKLGIGPGATKKQLLKAMEKHILAEGRLVGKYER